HSGPGSITSYNWSVSGNGTINGSTNSQSVSVVAGSSGSFTLTLTITNSSGCSSTCTKTVSISSSPSCAISGANAVCAQSTNNIYSGPGGAGFTYAWTITGNGTFTGGGVTPTGQTASVNAGAPGSFTRPRTVVDP